MENREIKFRAWDGSQMIYDGQDKIIKPKHLKSYSDDIFSRPTVTNKGVTMWFHETRLKYADDTHFDHIVSIPTNFIMQWTGLKDKNGKEIYEGDILKYEDGKNYKIGYSTETFSGDPSEQYIAAFILLDDHGCGQLICNVNRPYRYAEVIGNIHEHPELLK